MRRRVAGTRRSPHGKSPARGASSQESPARGASSREVAGTRRVLAGVGWHTARPRGRRGHVQRRRRPPERGLSSRRRGRHEARDWLRLARRVIGCDSRRRPPRRTTARWAAPRLRPAREGGTPRATRSEPAYPRWRWGSPATTIRAAKSKGKRSAAEEMRRACLLLLLRPAAAATCVLSRSLVLLKSGRSASTRVANELARARGRRRPSNETASVAARRALERGSSNMSAQVSGCPLAREVARSPGGTEIRRLCYGLGRRRDQSFAKVIEHGRRLFESSGRAGARRGGGERDVQGAGQALARGARGAAAARGSVEAPRRRRELSRRRLDAATAGSGRDRADPESADARGRASREAADRRISQTPHVVTHNPATVAGGCFGDARPGGARRLARLLKEDEETAVVAWTRRNALRIVLSQRCASLKGDWGGSSDACFPWNTTAFPARGWAGAAARAYGVERGAGAGEEGARRHDRGWVRGRATPREQPPIVRSDSIEPRDRPRDHRRDTAGAASRPSRATAAPPRRSTTRTSPPHPRKSSPTC